MFITAMQAAFSMVLGFLGKIVAKVVSTKLKKALSNILLQYLLRGYCDTCDCGKKGDTKDVGQSSSRILRVTVKTADQEVTVEVEADPKEEETPEEKFLADQCRLPLCRKRLVQLLRAAAS